MLEADIQLGMKAHKIKIKSSIEYAEREAVKFSRREFSKLTIATGFGLVGSNIVKAMDKESDEYKEANELAKKHIEEFIPIPSPSTALSTSGRARFEKNDFNILAKLYTANGVGPVASGRLMLCAPDLLDSVFIEAGVIDEADTVFTASYTSFGLVSAFTSSGASMTIDPLTSQLVMFIGEPSLAIFQQMEIAGDIYGAIDESKSPDQLIDLEGKDLHTSLSKQLGHLKYGEVFAFTRPINDEGAFKLENFEKTEISTYLSECVNKENFKITKA